VGSTDRWEVVEFKENRMVVNIGTSELPVTQELAKSKRDQAVINIAASELPVTSIEGEKYRV
jgi:hypothetical protein